MTLGGGMTMVYGFFAGSMRGWKWPADLPHLVDAALYAGRLVGGW